MPVVFRERQTETDLLEVALVENLQREDLNPLDAAEAYAPLERRVPPVARGRIADRVGKDRTTVTNALRLLKLPSAVRDRIRDGLLSGGHARALAALTSADDQERLADEIVRRALSVRQTEKRVAACGGMEGSAGERRRIRSRGTPRRSSRGTSTRASRSRGDGAVGKSRSHSGRKKS